LRLNKKVRNIKLDTNGSHIKFTILTKKQMNESTDLKSIVNTALSKSIIDFTLMTKWFDVLIPILKLVMSDFNIEVLRLSFLCDFIELTNEKLQKKTSFEGIINDNFHLSFGLRLPFFITEDKNLKIKAEFIKRWLNLPVQIFNMESFIKEVLTKSYRNEDNNDKQLTIEIQDNGTSIGIYEI